MKSVIVDVKIFSNNNNESGNTIGIVVTG